MRSGIELNDFEREVIIGDAKTELNGILALPEKAKGMIIFAHGSGSGRLSPRNNYVARVLQNDQFATLLMDLLSEEESLDRSNVFDIKLLAKRLSLAKKWLATLPETRLTPIGYFGASTGAAAALIAAAKASKNVFAVVSRGGRPDLAGPFLHKVKAPTLLIVGGNDEPVIELNKEAYQKLESPKEIKIVPGATHLFEEPGKLEQVALLASDWFSRHI